MDAMDVVAPWLRTDGSRVWTLQRLALAAVALPFGVQSGMPADAPLLVLAVATICSLLLALGLATRLAAVAVISVLVAGPLGGGGLALPLLGVALSLGLVARGGGVYSLDRSIVRQWTTLPLEQEITSDGLIVGRRIGEFGM